MGVHRINSTRLKHSSEQMHVIARDNLRLIALLFKLKPLNLIPTKYPALRLKIFGHCFNAAQEGLEPKA
jgi:hypothetical protein